MTLVLLVYPSLLMYMYIISPLSAHTQRALCSRADVRDRSIPTLVTTQDTLVPYRPLITGYGVLVHGYRGRNRSKWAEQGVTLPQTRTQNRPSWQKYVAKFSVQFRVASCTDKPQLVWHVVRLLMQSCWITNSIVLYRIIFSIRCTP